MNALVTSVDLQSLEALIESVRENHSHLQVYESYFRDETVVTLGFEVAEQTLSAVALAPAYIPFSLGLLGEIPLIVGYSYHNWHDSPAGNRGESITLSNRAYMHENNTHCITVRWTRFVDGRAQVYVQTEGFPQTWNEINDHPNNPAITPVGRASYLYQVDLFGGFILKERRFERLEESGELGGPIDRHLVRATIVNDSKESFTLEVQRIRDVHGDFNSRPEQRLTIEKKNVIAVTGTAPTGWEYLVESPTDDTELLAVSLIQQLSQEWDNSDHWIC